MSKRINDLIDEDKELERQILAVEGKTRGIPVTDHAIARYLERISEIDVPALRKIILPEETQDFIRKMGTNPGSYPVNGPDGEISHRVQIKDGHVVTVLTKEMT
tara:strand:+ start:93004 stop:93315 length:312 start_codon:yes stop_codon:yes gene_type:complete